MLCPLNRLDLLDGGARVRGVRRVKPVRRVKRDPAGFGSGGRAGSGVTRLTEKRDPADRQSGPAGAGRAGQAGQTGQAKSHPDDVAPSAARGWSRAAANDTLPSSQRVRLRALVRCRPPTELSPDPLRWLSHSPGTPRGGGPPGVQGKRVTGKAEPKEYRDGGNSGNQNEKNQNPETGHT